MRERRAGMTIDADGSELLGYAGILMGSEREELRPSRTGSLFLAYDLKRYKAEARAQVIQQSLYWAGWVTALALAMWLVFHFLLTRRTARLVRAAEQLAAGNLAARSGLKGTDELGRLSRAFDAHGARGGRHADTPAQDIAERKGAEEALRASEEQYRAMFNAADGRDLALCDVETGAIVDINPKRCAACTATARGVPGGRRPARSARRAPAIRADAMVLRRARWPASSSTIEVARASARMAILRWHEVHVMPVHYGGQDPHVLTIARDITEKKRSADGAGAAARIALPAREARRAGLAAGRRRPRAQQSAVGRRRARGAAGGAGRSGDTGPRR